MLLFNSLITSEHDPCLTWPAKHMQQTEGVKERVIVGVKGVCKRDGAKSWV